MLAERCKYYQVIKHTENEYECWVIPFGSDYATVMVRGTTPVESMMNAAVHLETHKPTMRFLNKKGN